MSRKISEKTVILENSKLKIKQMLVKIEKVSICNADLYVVEKEFYDKLLEIDLELSEYKTETKRGSIYSIDKIVNIINPKNEAISYHLTVATKSSLVTDKGKCIDRLVTEKEISKNRLYKIAKDKIEKDELDDFSSKKLMDEINQKILDEEEEFEKIKLNPDAYDIIISTYKERKEYGQINWQYIDNNNNNNNKIKTNKHLSIVYPNILIYKEYNEIDNHRSDMKVAKFIKDGYRCFGNVYVKKSTEN